MTASRPKTYSPCRETCVFTAVVFGAASMAVTASAATMATPGTILRIDPPWRTPEEHDEQAVDAEEEEDGGDPPADGGMRCRIARQADEVAHHVEHPGRRGDDFGDGRAG